MDDTVLDRKNEIPEETQRKFEKLKTVLNQMGSALDLVIVAIKTKKNILGHFLGK